MNQFSICCFIVPQSPLKVRRIKFEIEHTRTPQPDIALNQRRLRLSEQAGTGPSRRHIQGSKIAKRLPSVKYSFLQYSKIENFSKKNGPSGAPGLASASPWRAKVSQCRKTERGPFGIFQHPFCRKTAKK